jgi:DinB superfamily
LRRESPPSAQRWFDGYGKGSRIVVSIPSLQSLGTPTTSLSATAGLLQSLHEVDAGAIAVCRDLNGWQLSWQPRPGRWSIAENLAHLRGTTELFLPVIDSALAKSRQRDQPSNGPILMSPQSRLLLWTMNTSLPIRMRAPACLEPEPMADPLAEVGAFLAMQTAMRERMEHAAGYDLTGPSFRSPITSHLQFNLQELFLIFLAHGRRHLRQAKRVRCLLVPAVR